MPTEPTPAAAAAPAAVKPAETPATAPAVDPRVAGAVKQLQLAGKLRRETSADAEKVKGERAALAKEREEYAAWQKERAHFKLNPMAFLQRELGENAYDKLTELKLNGAPTADVVAYEMETREEKIRHEFEGKLSERDKKYEALEQQRAAAEGQKAVADYEAGALSYLKTNAEKFPILNELDKGPKVLELIRAHFTATAKKTDEGSVMGELLTPEQACEVMERQYREEFEKVSAAKAKTTAPNAGQQKKTVVFQAKPRTDAAPPNPAQTNSAGKPRSEKERREATRAAFLAVRNSNS